MKRLSKVVFTALSVTALSGTAIAQDAPEEGAEAGVDVEAGAAVDGTGAEVDAGATVGAETPVEDPAATGMMYTKVTWPQDFNARPLTLAKGMLEIRGDVFVNLSKEAAGEPFSLAPDLYYGVSDKLSVGLTHNLGICLAGEEGGCAKVYNDVGLDALLSVKRDASMELAAHVGLQANAIDPFVLALRVGGSLKFVAGKIAIYADPFIQVGITERDGEGVGAVGNKEAIGIPLAVAYQANLKLNAFVRTGLSGLNLGGNAGAAPFDGLGDAYTIPLGVGVLYAISNKLDVGAAFTLPLLVGGTNYEDLAGADARTLDLLINYRL